MLRYVFRRFLTAIPTLFVIVTIAFFLMRVAPGGPFNQEKGLNPVIKANLERVFHLDEPLWRQYLALSAKPSAAAISAQVTICRISPSLSSSRRACRFPSSSAPWRSSLALVIGSGLGIWAALRQNQLTDYVVVGVATAGSTIPTFVIAPLFQLFFALTLHWFPVGGWGGGAFINKVGPVLTLMLPQLAIVARLMRGKHDRITPRPPYSNRARHGPFRLFGCDKACAPGRASPHRILCRPRRRRASDGFGDRRNDILRFPA